MGHLQEKLEPGKVAEMVSNIFKCWVDDDTNLISKAELFEVFFLFDCGLAHYIGCRLH
jgi:hypothetical protein